MSETDKHTNKQPLEMRRNNSPDISLMFIFDGPGRRTASMPQISLAYCRIVRSDEKMPERAMLKMLMRAQRVLSRYVVSTS